MRRFTRLTNAFSKKVENHMHAISIYFMHYNFVRIHQSLRCTPAMEAGVTDQLGILRIWWPSWMNGKLGSLNGLCTTPILPIVAPLTDCEE
jgi:hypothetical protein